MRRVKSRLAVLMAERDPRLSQRELAQKSGVSPMAVNRLYNNDFKRVDTDTIEKICAFFDCELSDLLVLKDEQAPSKSKTRTIVSTSEGKATEQGQNNTLHRRTRSVLQIEESIEVVAQPELIDIQAS